MTRAVYYKETTESDEDLPVMTASQPYGDKTVCVSTFVNSLPMGKAHANPGCFLIHFEAGKLSMSPPETDVASHKKLF